MVELSSYTRTGCPIDRTTNRRCLAETNHLRLAQTAHGRLPPTHDEIVRLHPESTGGAPGEIGRGDRAAGREQGVGEDCGGVERAGRIAVMYGTRQCRRVVSAVMRAGPLGVGGWTGGEQSFYFIMPWTVVLYCMPLVLPFTPLGLFLLGG